MGRHHTKTVVVVEVVDVVVATGTTRVPLIVVEGTATQHTAFHRSAPPPEDDIRIIQQFQLCHCEGVLVLCPKQSHVL